MSDERGERRKRRHSKRREEDSTHFRSSREQFKPPEFIFVVKYHLDDGNNGLNTQYEIDEQRVVPRSSNKQNSCHETDQQQQQQGESYNALHEINEAGKTRFGSQNNSASSSADPYHLDSTNKQSINKSQDDDDDDSVTSSSSTSSSSSYHGSDPSNCTQEENSEVSDSKKQHEQNQSNINIEQKSFNSSNKQRQQKQQRQIYRHRQGGMVSICSVLPPIIEEGSDIDSSYSSRMSQLHDLRLSITSGGENIDLVSALGMEVLGAIVARDLKLGDIGNEDAMDADLDQEVNNWNLSAQVKSPVADDAHEEGYWNDIDDLDVAEKLMKAGARDTAISKSQEAAVAEEKQIQDSCSSSHYRRHNSAPYEPKSPDKSQDTLSASMPELSKSANKYSPINRAKSTVDRNSSFMEALRIVDSESKKKKNSDKPRRRPSGGSIEESPIRRRPSSGGIEPQSSVSPLFKTDLPKVRPERHARKKSPEFDTDRAKPENHKGQKQHRTDIDRGKKENQSPPSTKSETQSSQSKHHHKQRRNSNELDNGGRSNSEIEEHSSNRHKIKSHDSKAELTKSRSKRHSHHKHHDSNDLDVSGRSSDSGKNESSKSSKSSEPIKSRSRRHAKHKDAAETDTSERSSDSKEQANQAKIPSSMKQLLKSLPTHHGHQDPADINEAISILSTAIEVLKAQESKSRPQTIHGTDIFDQGSASVSGEHDVKLYNEDVKLSNAVQSEPRSNDSHHFRGSITTVDSSIAVPLSDTSSLIGGSSSVAVPPTDYSGFMDSNSSLAYPPSEGSDGRIEGELDGSSVFPPWEDGNDDVGRDREVSCSKPGSTHGGQVDAVDQSDDPDLAKALAESLAVSPWENDCHDGNADLEDKPQNMLECETEDQDLAKALAESLAAQQHWENSSNDGIDDSDTSRWRPEVSMNESELFSGLKHRNTRLARVNSKDLSEPLSKSSDSSSLALQGDNSSGDLEAIKWKTHMKSDSNSSASLATNDDPQDDVEPDKKPSKGLIRLVRPKSIQHGIQQKSGFMSKVRHSFTSSQSVKSLSRNLPAMGIHAIEEGAIAIEDLKKKVKERKQKITPNGDVVLDRRRTLDETQLRNNHNTATVDQEVGQLDDDSTFKSKDDHLHVTGEKSGSSDTNVDRCHNRKSSTRSSQSSFSRSTVSRRSSTSSTSSNRRKCGLSSSLPCLNALNTNDRGEPITWDDLEDAISIGLHNSLSDVNAEVSHKQDWRQQSLESISHVATNAPTTRKETQETSTEEPVTSSATVNAKNGGQKGPWRCSFCTVINENPLHLICSVCNLPRDN